MIITTMLTTESRSISACKGFLVDGSMVGASELLLRTPT